MYVFFSDLGLASGGITSVTFVALGVVAAVSVAFALVCENFDKKAKDKVEQNETLVVEKAANSDFTEETQENDDVSNDSDIDESDEDLVTE